MWADDGPKWPLGWQWQVAVGGGLAASGHCRASLNFSCRVVLTHGLGGQPKHGLSCGPGQPRPEFYRAVPGSCQAFFSCFVSCHHASCCMAKYTHELGMERLDPTVIRLVVSNGLGHE